jgi:hypothetical protein
MSDQSKNQDAPAPNAPGAGEMTTSPDPKAGYLHPKRQPFPQILVPLHFSLVRCPNLLA